MAEEASRSVQLDEAAMESKPIPPTNWQEEREAEGSQDGEQDQEIPLTPITAIQINGRFSKDERQQQQQQDDLPASLEQKEGREGQQEGEVSKSGEKIDNDFELVDQKELNGNEKEEENQIGARTTGDDGASLPPINDSSLKDEPLPSIPDQPHQEDEHPALSSAAMDGSNSIPSISVASSSPTLNSHQSLPLASSSQTESEPSTEPPSQAQSFRSSIPTISRRDSNISTTSISSSNTHSSKSGASLAAGSAVFVISALDSILTSKEAKKLPALRSACGRALAMVRHASGQKTPTNASKEERERSSEGKMESLDARIVFEPLKLACETKSSTLVVIALDCIGKLVSYSFFVEDDDQEEVNPVSKINDDGEPLPGSSAPLPLADLVTETVCETFSSSLSDLAQLQIIKALLATVLSTSVSVHQGSLLKAVRTVYNVFLMSKSTANQAVAQGCLTQMCHHVCGRVRPGKQREKVREEESTRANGLVNEPQASTQQVQEHEKKEVDEEVGSPPLEDVQIDPTSTSSYSDAAVNVENGSTEATGDETVVIDEEGKEKRISQTSEEKVTL